MFTTKSLTKALAGSLVLASLALTGCGSSAVNATDPYATDPNYTDPSYTDPSGGYTDPSTGYNNGGYTNGGNAVPGTTTPGYGNLPAGNSTPLTASVIKKKNGSFLGMGKYVATVEVTNPAQVQQSGTLTVTFTDGSSKKVKGTESKTVTLAPGATQTFEFTNKSWTTDDASAEITTDTPAVPVGTGTGYNNGTGTGYGY